MAPIDVIQAQSQAATAQQNLVAAQGAMRTAELALKRLIVGGTQDPNWNVQLDPVGSSGLSPRGDRPRSRGPARPRRAHRSATSRKDNVRGQRRHAALPEGSAACRRPTSSRSYGLAGVGGTQLITNRAPASTRPVDRHDPRRLRRCAVVAVQRLPDAGPSQMNFSYPLGISSQKAVGRARARAAEPGPGAGQADRAAGRDRRDQRRRSTCRATSSACRRRRPPASWRRRQLEAEQSKFEVGMSTNYFVVQAQRDLATAQNNELQAILELSQSARRARAAAADDAAELERHGRWAPVTIADAAVTRDDGAS